MCGISGILSFNNTAPEENAIQRMMDKLVHRGPDSGGMYKDGPVILGHRRLAIIDLSSKANQPLVDAASGLVVVFNGTIYNYRELREELKLMGYQFNSDGDTEAIVKAYHAWGDDCVKRLSGMFAFAIWDSNKKELFIARDRMGIKPLYYSNTDSRFQFASTLQALITTGDVDTTIDAVAMHHQFTLHAVVPAPRTILNGVKKLEPGSYMKIDQHGKIVVKKYWTLNATRPHDRSQKARSEEEWVELIHTALRRSVERRKVIADVPVGILLSGGLDSSLLVGLLSEAGTEKILTFSIGFEDTPEESGSEFVYSDKVVERFDTEHTKVHIPNAEVLARLPEAIDHMSEPMFGQDAVAFYMLAEQVSKEVKVVQSGQGADEVFGGYFWYPQMQQERGSDLHRFSSHYFDRHHDEFLEMVSEEYRGDDYTSTLIEKLLVESKGETFLDKVLHMDVTTLIVDDPVKRVDNMTMAWGLEARVPFLDQEVVELAAQMPPELKLKSGGKFPLKSIARGLIPDEVIDRPKGYFPMPALKYVRGEFYDFMKTILQSSACQQRGLYHPAYVAKLLNSPEDHMTPLQGSKLWHLALLECWLQRNVDVVTN
ncbi:MAG: N-acetylglutaminylglutamine amidotransferase [Gammaproteobacteria bacterium]|nr:N-acetylglutaminylglutamine amidotransferase [Gammaproteobacteria bacterium]